jgi:hypothetical protein
MHTARTHPHTSAPSSDHRSAVFRGLTACRVAFFAFGTPSATPSWGFATASHRTKETNMATGTFGDRTTNNSSFDWLERHRDLVGFSSEEWRRLVNDDRVALSGVSLLLTSIIAMGMLGMLVVVGILAFG